MTSQIFSPICIKNKQSVQICCSMDCKNNCFMCYDMQCSCSIQHQQCEKINWSYFKKKMNNNIVKATREFKIIEQLIQQSYQNMISLVTNFHNDFKQWKNDFGFTEREREFVRLAHQNKFSQITGEKIYYILSQLKNPSKIIFGGQVQIRKEIEVMNTCLNTITAKLKKLYERTKLTKEQTEIKVNNPSNLLHLGQVQYSSLLQQETIDKVSSIKLVDEWIPECIQNITLGLNEQAVKITKIQQTMNHKIKKLQNQLYGIRNQVQRDRQNLNKSIKQLNEIDQLLSPDMDISIVMKPQFQINLLLPYQQVLQKKLQIKINSRIISKISQISGFFKERSIEDITLLFRASQNKFSITKFHELCDKIPHTIIIIKTEFGKIIGGYTPIMWDSQRHSQWEQDPNRSTFLFSLTENSRIDLVNKFKCILQRSDYGPIFGSGATLLIADKSNQSKNSHCAGIGSGFKNELFNQSNQECKERFSGQKEGHTFKILEWEVFKIKFSDSYKKI